VIHNDDIKGIYMNGSENKLVHYADNTWFLLNASENSLHDLVKTLHAFAFNVGTKSEYQQKL
jgi:hypothetical protein